jgi:hypothetical protein
MPPDIAQALGHHLKDLGGEPIVNRQIALSLDVYRNPGGRREFLSKAPHRQEESILVGPAVA